jgi:D-threo-aldose 1-dehydrogenase
VVRSVVVGAATADQVRQNAERVRAEVPAGLWDQLAAEGLIPS